MLSIFPASTMDCFSVRGSCTYVKLIMIATLFCAWCWMPSTVVAADRSLVTFLRGQQDLRSRAGGRALQGDSSPPGMWGDDDDESFHVRRRALLSDVQDISPPGMWSDDEYEHFQSTKRALLSDLGDVSPPGLGGGDDGDEYFHDGSRTLLSILRDVSPPGLWPSGNDDYDEFVHRRRSLLANPEEFDHQLHSKSALGEDGGHAGVQFQVPKPRRFRLRGGGFGEDQINVHDTANDDSSVVHGMDANSRRSPSTCKTLGANGYHEIPNVCNTHGCDVARTRALFTHADPFRHICPPGPPQEPSSASSRMLLSKSHCLQPSHGQMVKARHAQVDTPDSVSLKGRSLFYSVRDISPPGVGTGGDDDDDDNEMARRHRRTLLSNFQDAPLHGGMIVVDRDGNVNDGMASQQAVPESPECDFEASQSTYVNRTERECQFLHQKLCVPQNVRVLSGHVSKWSRQLVARVAQFFLQFPIILGRSHPSPTLPQGDVREGCFSSSNNQESVRKSRSGDFTQGPASQSAPLLSQAVPFLSSARIELPASSQVHRLSLPGILLDERGYLSQ